MLPGALPSKATPRRLSWAGGLAKCKKVARIHEPEKGQRHRGGGRRTERRGRNPSKTGCGRLKRQQESRAQRVNPLASQLVVAVCTLGGRPGGTPTALGGSQATSTGRGSAPSLTPPVGGVL